jgi:hypothetical protein
MSFDKSKFEKINDSAYVYKNFLSEKQCNNLIYLSKKFLFKPLFDTHDAIFASGELINQSFLPEMMREFLDKETFAGGFAFGNTPKNGKWPVHTDSEGKLDKGVKTWGGILYLNNFEGGDVFYPETNTSYHPNLGDIVLHTKYVEHGVKEVLSDVRKTIIFHLWELNNND